MDTVFVRAKPISRANGQNAVACSAYRSCSKLYDEQNEKQQNYTRKNGLVACGLALPNGENISRQKLWNLAEKTENRKDAQTAKEYIIAIPHYMPDEDKILCCKKIANHLAENGRAVDWAIHKPNRKGDERNFHCHMMMTTRELKNGELNKKKNRDWNTREFLANEKKEIAEIFNHRLRILGLPEIDDRTYEEKIAMGENPPIPQEHNGVAKTNAERNKQRKIKTLERKINALEELIEQEKKTNERSNGRAGSTGDENRNVEKSANADNPMFREFAEYNKRENEREQLEFIRLQNAERIKRQQQQRAAEIEREKQLRLAEIERQERIRAEEEQRRIEQSNKNNSKDYGGMHY